MCKYLGFPYRTTRICRINTVSFVGSSLFLFPVSKRFLADTQKEPLLRYLLLTGDRTQSFPIAQTSSVFRSPMASSKFFW